MQRYFYILFSILLLSSPLHAEEEEDAPKPPPKIPESQLPSYYFKDSPFRLITKPDQKRGIFFPQIFSFLIPGLDQIIEHQFDSGLIYLTMAVGGLAYADNRRSQMTKENFEKEKKETYNSKDNYFRGYNLGIQIYQLAGGLSTYHSFRTAVRSRLQYGEFAFLKEEETRSDLLLAPFRFDFVLRKTTWIPLALATAIAIYENTPGALQSQDLRSTPLKSSDYFYTAASSYEAGISEEAIFRGWMLPALRHQMDSTFYANITQAAIFGLAHLGAVKVPILQALFGFYLGGVTIENNWTISESIFIHTWWDVAAFLSGYSSTKKNPTAKVPSIVIPLEWHF